MNETQEPAIEMALSPRTRQFIVLVALLQGLLLYLAKLGQEQGWPLFSELGGRVCWYTLVLSVPMVALLSVRRLDEARFWQHVALVAAIFAALAGWAAWSATGAPGLVAGEVLGPFGASTAAALFVALPYLQCRLPQDHWCAPYPQLFEHAWQNGLTLLLTLLFVGISWLVLHLWAGLFDLIGIDFFKELFRKDPFVYLASGTMVGLGILIGRTQQRAVQVARRILFAIFTGLLPLLAAVAVMFVLSLPFTGLDSLWSTRSAAFLLLALVGVLVLFVNAVYQDGDDPVPYPRWLRRVVEAGLLTLPIFAVLALYALWLRIDQYGWTSARIAGVVAAMLLTGHAFGYAWAALRPAAGWLAPLRRVNVVVSLAAIAVTVLVNSPVLDPHRISVNSQVARLDDGRTPAADFDVAFLRFESGRLGYRAAQSLRSSPVVTADADLARRLAKSLARSQRHQELKSPEQLRRDAVSDVDAVRQRIVVAPGTDTTDTIDTSWWQSLVAQKLGMETCLQADSDCVLIGRDLDGDGQQERLLCDLSRDWALQCQVYARVQGQWQAAGTVNFHTGPKVKLRDALRRGDVRVSPRRWPDLEVAGQRAGIEVEAEPSAAKAIATSPPSTADGDND